MFGVPVRIVGALVHFLVHLYLSQPQTLPPGPFSHPSLVANSPEEVENLHQEIEVVVEVLTQDPLGIAPGLVGG